MLKLIVTSIVSIITSVITTVTVTYIKEYIKQPFFHVTMCNNKHEQVRLNSVYDFNGVLQISNDSQDVLAFDVVAFFKIDIEGSNEYWQFSKILSNRIDNKHPMYVSPFEDLPAEKKYKVNTVQLFYTKCTRQKRWVSFNFNDKMIIQSGKTHIAHYSLTDEDINKKPYKLSK